jgi:hypothetical protein
MEKAAQESNSAENSSVQSLDSALLRVSENTLATKNLLSISFQKFREEIYAPAVQALPQEDREILSKQIQVLEETKKLPSVESACAEQLRELRMLSVQLHSYCEGVCALREQIVASRTVLVTALNDELPGIRLEFKKSSNREARDRFQGRHQSDGASFFGYLDTYTGNDGYEKLRDLFAKLQNLDVDHDKWKIQDQLIDAKFVELLDVIDDDDVDIFLEVGKRGFAPIQSLSAGQRCVAVFPLLLRNTRGPLVIDQPEDNLDNRYIADTIGPDLLNKKLGQQYLVTSHNANLVVLTDADLIVHVDSDGTHAEFPAAGFLAWKKSLVKESVIGVLDGGEAALLVRQKKYGI